ncbi:hypothetical protein L228DRAFT_258651 [Xylona heveae TC161]|uniref:PQ loop repeat protein n=1 Tax=Xylona heveae (strain CBS 132557 / TC161) TaxID=1328760 RepID=A0A165IPL0_XYLHT|nr:hypothetical protein L228DRAFT_258651 [Xylona heveae TC161]KZF25195.1 hypothetical protein L228DRAFT_258651 [Xylona heveae TC161]
MDVPVAANVLGVTGAICWSVQLIPQIIINYRRHNTTGLQPSMMMLWAWAGVPLGVYNIVEDFNVALKIQPQILSFLSLLTWTQCHYYEKKWSIQRCSAVVLPIALLMSGVEAGLIFTLRLARERGFSQPITTMAVLSATLLAAGVLRHYVDIYKHRTVRGISFIFVGIDAAGDVFSLVSVFFEPHLNILGMVIYGTELVLWMGIFICGAIFNFAPWAKKKYNSSSTLDHRTRNTSPRQEGMSPHASSDAITGIDMGSHRTRMEPVTLHNLPSSTSVFRTPSSEFRNRRIESR